MKPCKVGSEDPLAKSSCTLEPQGIQILPQASWVMLLGEKQREAGAV